MEKGLYKLEKAVIYFCVLLLPLLILPIFPNIFVTPKLILLTLCVAALLTLLVIKMLVSKKLDLKFSRFDFPLLLIAVSYLVSGILRTPNKMEAFFLPGDATLVISSFLFYFFTNQLEDEDKTNTKLVISLSAALVSILSILSISGVMNMIPMLPAYVKQISFTTVGGNLPAVMFLAYSVVLTFAGLKMSKSVSVTVSTMAMVAIITMGLLANIYLILPGKDTSPRFADNNTYWSIAIDSLKESPLLGIGPGNYLSAFNRYRPINYNSSDLWQVRFANAKSFVVSAMTEAGLLSFTGFALLAILFYGLITKEFKNVKEEGLKLTEKPELTSGILLFVLLILFPASPVVIFIFFLSFVFLMKTNKITLFLSAQKPHDQVQNAFAERIPAILVSIPLVVAIFFYGFYLAKTTRAEYTFQKSLDAFSRNDAQTTYNLMREAIAQNPYVDRYHTAFSQVNFAIANSISQKPQGEQLTDEERNSVSQLIQQAIDSGKNAIALNPTRSSNWELLGSTYRSIMAYAQGADQYAIDSYSQAIALDPLSPNLRVELGGVYFATGNYDQAIEVFKLAVLTKPNLANSRYNLAIAYREKKDYDKAIAEMENVLALLDKDSKDYELAKKELENLNSKNPAKAGTTTEGDELMAPEKTQPGTEPQIELPEDAKPPEPEVTPTPQPEQTQAPTATPQS